MDHPSPPSRETEDEEHDAGAEPGAHALRPAVERRGEEAIARCFQGQADCGPGDAAKKARLRAQYVLAPRRRDPHQLPVQVHLRAVLHRDLWARRGSFPTCTRLSSTPPSTV